MATQITNYQCPACTGPLHFAGESGKLECEYCGSAYDVAEIEALYKEKDQAAAAAQAQAEAKSDEARAQPAGDDAGDWGEDAQHLRTYNCPSCGAELICDESTAATSCPYCGNPSIVPGQFTNMRKPDYVLPFALSKDKAVAALKRYYKGKVLLPKAFADTNHIEDIKGVYVPFWLFDGEVEADMRFHATRVHSHVRGNERITVTEHFQVRRAGSVAFSQIPVDASSKMPDAHMDAIEPFNYADLKDFSMAYLPGFMADKYDVDAEECAKRVDERAENTAESIMRESVVGYATCITESKNLNVRRSRVGYALLPVWMLSTQWNGQNFLFAMNGQTGKLIGDLPVDKGRFLAWFAGIAVPLTAVIYALLSAFGGAV